MGQRTKNIKLVILGFIICGPILFFAVSASAVIDGYDTMEQEAKYEPYQLIVKLKEGFTLPDIQELNAKYSVISTEKLFKDIHGPGQRLLENVYLLTISEEIDLMSMVSDYESHPAVEYAEPNYRVEVQPTPEKPLNIEEGIK